MADSTDDEKPFSFSLPENENSYYTKKFHPVRRTLFAQGEMVPRVSSSPTSSSDYPSQNHNFTFSLEEPGLNATFADPRPQSEHSNKRKALAEEIEAGERPTGTKMMKPSSFSSVHEGTTRAIPEDSSIASSNASGAVKRAPQKWSKLEKKLFVDVVEKHGMFR